MDKPRPPEPPKMPPIQMVKDGGGGGGLFVIVAVVVVIVMFSMCRCTTTFPTDRDSDVDTMDVAESPDPGVDSLEVLEDTEDDGGGETDPERDAEEDTEPDGDDPCDYYPTWYRDMDMDGWGRDDEVVCFPTQPEGYVDRGGDCCDQRHEVHPGVTEWQAEPYVCPDESWDWNCDGVDEIRWLGLDPARCEPFCGYDCYEVGTTPGLCEGIWWVGGVTPPCGEGYAEWQCRWNTDHCGAGGGPFLPQQCR